MKSFFEMPALPKVTIEKIVSALCDVNIFRDDEGNIKNRSDDVWKAASQILNGKVSATTLSLYARLNRNNILYQVKERCGIAEIPNTSANITLNTTTSADSCISEYTIFDQKETDRIPNVFYNIDVSDDDWKKISPITRKYKDKGGLRSYDCLQEPWTDIIAKLCYEKSKIPCAYSFKRAKITADGVWLKIFGSCKECKSTFKGHCLSKPKPNTGISIAVSVADTRCIPHMEKRHLKGTSRIAVGEELLNKKGSLWRKEAAKCMDFGDAEPSHIPRPAVLRKIREEANNRFLGIQKGLDVIHSLHQFKYDGEFANYIKEIGLDEFYCIYCSPMQLAIYKDQIGMYIQSTLS